MQAQQPDIRRRRTRRECQHQRHAQPGRHAAQLPGPIGDHDVDQRREAFRQPGTQQGPLVRRRAGDERIGREFGQVDRAPPREAVAHRDRDQHSEPQPLLLWLHGGGFVGGAVDDIDVACAGLARRAGVGVISLGYRLAPEHPFPAAVDDAVAAYRWLLGRGTNPAVLAVAGDSAGGGLALASLVALRDAGEPMPAAAVVLSPWTDLALTGESLRTRAAVDVMIKPAGMAETARTYLAGQDPRHPYASPLYADVHGLPPVLIHVGDAEVILDDSTRFAARARDHGVDVTLEVWDEMPHVWHAFAGLLPEADQAIDRIGCWLTKRIPAP